MTARAVALIAICILVGAVAIVSGVNVSRLADSELSKAPRPRATQPQLHHRVPMTRKPKRSDRNCIHRPSSCGYPDASTTGVPAGTRLIRSGPITADQKGQVIEGLDITGEVNVVAPDVTIRMSRITGGRGVGPADWIVIIRPGATGLRIEDVEVRTPEGSPQDNACIFNIGDVRPTIIRANIHGCSAGVSTGGGLVQDSYIHDLSQVPGLSHVVGIASNGGGGLTVRHNTILNQFDQTATVALYQDFGIQRDDLIEQNLVGGGGYCFYGGAGERGVTKNIRFVRNRLSRIFHPHCGSYGILAAFTTSDPGNMFKSNFWDESGAKANL